MIGKTQFDVPELVREAHDRCQAYLVPTPLERSSYLSEQIHGEVWLKLESMQRTASFKFRGAINKILTLTESELERGVVSASTGNHALAIAEAVRIRGYQATIYVGSDIDETRLALLKAQGLDVVVVDGGAWDAEKEARRVGEDEDKIYVSPYNDPIVVGGQGTCGYEIASQFPDVEAVLLACGGGGLLGGSSAWLKHHNPKIRTYGVSPEHSPVMYEAIRQRKIKEIEISPTLADTCAGNIDLDSITLDICLYSVDEMMLISEAEIESAIRLIFEQHCLVVEGAGALTVAALLKHTEIFAGK